MVIGGCDGDIIDLEGSFCTGRGLCGRSSLPFGGFVKKELCYMLVTTCVELDVTGLSFFGWV